MKCDETILTKSLVALLLESELYPNGDEASAISSYDGEGKLNKVERYFKALCDVKNLKTRLECMNTVHQFDSIKEDIEERLKILSEASKQVRESQTFKRLLELALVVGNILNGGNSSRGLAKAFKINTLEKLATTKGFDKKTTVLNAMIQLYKKMYGEEDIDLLMEWSQVKQASLTGISELEKKVRNIVTQSKKLSKECAAQRDPKIDRLNITLQDDAKKIEMYVKTLMARFETTKTSCANLFVSMGEKSTLSDDDTAKFWTALHKFALSIRQTQLDIQKQKELEEKRAQKEKEKEAKKTTKSKNVFDNYAKLKKGNEADIVAMMTRGGRTRRARRSKGSPRVSEVRKTTKARPTSLSRRRLVQSDTGGGQHGKGLAAEAAASRRRLRAGRRRK